MSAPRNLPVRDTMISECVVDISSEDLQRYAANVDTVVIRIHLGGQTRRTSTKTLRIPAWQIREA